MLSDVHRHSLPSALHNGWRAGGSCMALFGRLGSTRPVGPVAFLDSREPDSGGRLAVPPPRLSRASECCGGQLEPWRWIHQDGNARFPVAVPVGPTA
jgi:hypothetical protein